MAALADDLFRSAVLTSVAPFSAARVWMNVLVRWVVLLSAKLC